MTLNEAIAAINEQTSLSAEARNALHGATAGHPWCAGKTLEQRRQEVLCAIAGRKAHGMLIQQVERAKE